MVKNLKEKICLTVDVEEYFHAANLSRICDVKTWSKLPSRVEQSTNKLLDVFDNYKSKGTFFILGYCAKKHPLLVKEIKKRGHEIASHGYSHKMAFTQSPKQFKKDVIHSKAILEDLTGEPLFGYRAPNFSIVNKNLWAYEILASAGYRYDSSLNPIRHLTYGNAHRSPKPQKVISNGIPLSIFPLATFNFDLINLKLPIAGGAYWRILPWKIFQSALSYKIKFGDGKYNVPICYLHPWEIDCQQPFFSKIEFTKKIRHYFGIKNFMRKIDAALNQFESITIESAYLTQESLTGALPEFIIPSSVAAA